MLIYIIDDEPLVLRTIVRTVQEAAPDAELESFRRVQDLLDRIADTARKPDVVFSDIEMPGMGGLELALEIKNQAPDTRIVFVTGYSEYALDAYQMHVEGYVMKPVTIQRIREELRLVHTEKPIQPLPGKDKLQVRCFGAFEVFWKGEPLSFSRVKAKELLAYLVDRRGELCTGGEIILALWGEEGTHEGKKAYLRTLTANLRTTLSDIGMEELLVRRHRQWAIRPDLLDCDYYRMLAGDMEAANSYHGEYMSRYSWAELTAAKLYFHKE